MSSGPAASSEATCFTTRSEFPRTRPWKRRATQEFREDYNLRRNEELAALQKIVQKTIAEIAKLENYDLVLESAVYVGPKADITDKILKRLGKK